MKTVQQMERAIVEKFKDREEVVRIKKIETCGRELYWIVLNLPYEQAQEWGGECSILETKLSDEFDEDVDLRPVSIAVDEDEHGYIPRYAEVIWKSEVIKTNN